MWPEVTLALALALTAMTLVTWRVGRDVDAATREAVTRLRRVDGRLRLAEHVAASQQLVEDIQGAATETAEGIARIVRAVIRGAASPRPDHPRSPDAGP